MNNSTAHSVRRFTKNTQGRDLIVGDTHGCFTKLADALDLVGFDPDAGDRLFSVGDLVDRGPECDCATDWLAQPWFFAVAGNHEDMAVRWPHGFMEPGSYMANGGGWNIGNPPELQREIAATFAALPIAIELETEQGLVGIVHAECPTPVWADFVRALQDPVLSRRRLDELVSCAQWSRTRVMFSDDSIIEGVRAVVVGHTPMERMTSLGNTIFIDTGAWLQGGKTERKFTILDAATLSPARRP